MSDLLGNVIGLLGGSGLTGLVGGVEADLGTVLNNLASGAATQSLLNDVVNGVGSVIGDVDGLVGSLGLGALVNNATGGMTTTTSTSTPLLGGILGGGDLLGGLLGSSGLLGGLLGNL
jgi:phage-related minor tail protein